MTFLLVFVKNCAFISFENCEFLGQIVFPFPNTDVIDGDIKSILDLMWLLILNYGVHSIGE